MSDVQMQLAAGNYAAAIQDELGNMGATATMSYGGVVVTGTAGVAPTSSPQSAHATQPAVIVSLSPAAQTILSGAQIALDMITAACQGEQGTTPGSATLHGSGTTTKPASALQAPSLIQPSTGEVISSPSDPSISEIVQQAKAALSDPTSVFYGVVNQAGGPGAWSAFMGSEEQQSFVDAFNSKTLTIQNASDVAGLDYMDHTVLSGTSQSGTMSINGAWRESQDMLNGTYSTGWFMPVEGGTWSKTTTSTNHGP